MKKIAKNIVIALSLLVIGAPLFTASCEDFKYNSHGKRDPFVSLIGEDKNLIGRLADVTSVEDLKLEGVALGPKGSNTAILNGEIVKEKQKIGEIEIVKISADTVELLISNKSYSLKLSEEGGSKE